MGIEHITSISNGSTLNSNFLALHATKKPAIAAMVASFIFLYLANYVHASSGGIMGGSNWDSSSSSLSSDDLLLYPHWSSSLTHEHRLNSEQPESLAVGFLVFIFAAGIIILIVVVVNNNGRKISVIKLQIGLFGKLRSLQNDLNQIARTVDTSTRAGMRSVLTGTLNSLITHHKSFTSVYSSSKILLSIDDGKKMFDDLSHYEEGKFDEQTLVNVNNMRRERTESVILSEASDMYLVVTILVAAQGKLELSSINTCEELIEALQKLLSIPESKTMAVRVLWTPQQELDKLLSEQLIEDYLQLKPLKAT